MAQIDDITLMAYVDGELDTIAMRRVADAIKGDPERQEQVRVLRQSAALVRAVFEDPAYTRVSPSVVKAVLTPRHAAAKRLETWRFAWPVAASIAAAALFASGFTLGDMHGQQPSDFSERLRGEVADYHVIYAQEHEHQVEVPAARLDHIQAWLGERLHRTLRVPDLAAHGLAFEGARLLVVDSKPVAQLIYRWSDQPQHPFALCISVGAPGEEAFKTDRREGVNLGLWRRNGYTYILVGWVDDALLGQLAAEVAPELDRS